MACRFSVLRCFRFRNALLLLLCFTLLSPACFSADHQAWDELLKAHTDDGLINYGSFQGDKAKLDDYLNGLARYPLESFSNETREERIALWINIFNALVIQEILRHYPVESVSKISNFWDQKRPTVSGLSYSFLEIRDQILRGSFRDERALLALVTGEMSSAPLRNEAYVGSRLSEQLADQMNFFLTHERYNEISNRQKKLRLSPLFREYENDFILGYGQLQETGKFSPQQFAVLNFIKVHLKDPELQDWIVQSKYKVSYFKKDVNLNEIKRNEKEQ